MHLLIISWLFRPLGLQLVVDFVSSVHNLLVIFHGALIQVLAAFIINRRMLLLLLILLCKLSID